MDFVILFENYDDIEEQCDDLYNSNFRMCVIMNIFKEKLLRLKEYWKKQIRIREKEYQQLWENL